MADQQTKPNNHNVFGTLFPLFLFAAFAVFILVNNERIGQMSKGPSRDEVDGGKHIKWQKPHYAKFRTFKETVAAAKKAKRPIFLDLYADWCHPCKKLEKQTFSHPSVRELLDKYYAVKFNIDKAEGKALVRRFRVNRFPTTLMLGPDGRERERVVGFYSPRFFRPAVLAALTNKDLYTQLWWQHRKQPKNLTLQLKLADRSLLRRKIKAARKHYNALMKADPQDKQGFGSKGLFGLAKSYSRVGKYTQALRYIERFHKRYPKSKVRIDTYRLELYCYGKLKDRGSRASRRIYQKKYRALKKQFKKRYNGRTTAFH